MSRSASRGAKSGDEQAAGLAAFLPAVATRGGTSHVSIATGRAGAADHSKGGVNKGNVRDHSKKMKRAPVERERAGDAANEDADDDYTIVVYGSRNPDWHQNPLAGFSSHSGAVGTDYTTPNVAGVPLDPTSQYKPVEHCRYGLDIPDFTVLPCNQAMSGYTCSEINDVIKEKKLKVAELEGNLFRNGCLDDRKWTKRNCCGDEGYKDLLLKQIEALKAVMVKCCPSKASPNVDISRW
jgi:hypothetical protein